MVLALASGKSSFKMSQLGYILQTYFNEKFSCHNKTFKYFQVIYKILK